MQPSQVRTSQVYGLLKLQFVRLYNRLELPWGRAEDDELWDLARAITGGWV